MITRIIPIIVNHFWPYWLIKLVKVSPNLKNKYDTIKNLRPLEIKLIKIKTEKLNLSLKDTNQPLFIEAEYFKSTNKLYE